jgi:flagellar hook protein FlgE
MSLMSSLWIGTSGLDAHGNAISVVGDNIANVSTIGFRGARADFEEVLGDTAPNTQRTGSGVRFGGTQTLFGQGAIKQTGVDLDLAIRGNGFFQVSGNHDGIEGNYYSRDGRFRMDNEGFVVNTEGLRLQGYTISPTGQLAAAPGDLQLGGQAPPVATTTIDMAVNLDSDSVPPPLAFDPNDASNTSNFSTSTTVYDSLGTAHRVDVYFRSNGGGSWEWHALADGGELSGGTPGTPQEIGSGAMTFTTDGALDTESVFGSTADFLNATPGQALNFDFGDALADGGTGMAGSTQFSSASNVITTNQDGFGSGALVDLQISDDGVITGQFSNGQTREMAQIAIASFASEEGLRRSGSQLFAETSESGGALVAAASSGGRGAISSGALESANVDLGTELVSLIAYQRAFSANARTVTTADEMLQEISGLKR